MELFSAYPKLRLLPESRQEFSCRLRGMRGAVTCRYLLVGVTRLRSTPARLFLLRSNRPYTQLRSLVVDHMRGGEYLGF